MDFKLSVFALSLLWIGTAARTEPTDGRPVAHAIILTEGSEPIVFREGDHTNEVIKRFFGVESLSFPGEPQKEEMVLGLKELVGSSVVTRFDHGRLISALAMALNEGHLSVHTETQGRISYLEIGCFDGSNFRKQLNHVNPHRSYCVDPDETTGATTHYTTSDIFFHALHNESPETRFQLIFVDGLHTADQTLRDVWNALEYLDQGGVIVIHDAAPVTERAAIRNCKDCNEGIWNGDVFRGVMALRADPNVDVAVGNFDYGCAVVMKRKNSDPRWVGVYPRDHYVREYELSFRDFDENRHNYLRLMSPAEILNFAGVRPEAIPDILSKA